MIRFVLSVWLGVLSVPAIADDTGTPVRTARRYGVYLSVVGDLVPGFASLNGAFNVTEKVQLGAAFSWVPSLWTAGALGVKYLPLGGRPFTPVLGVGLGVLRSSGPFSAIGNFLARNVGEPGPPAAETLFLITPSAGIDWQTGGGFNLGAGLTYPISPKLGGAAYPIPYLNLGWFF